MTKSNGGKQSPLRLSKEGLKIMKATRSYSIALIICKAEESLNNKLELARRLKDLEFTIGHALAKHKMYETTLHGLGADCREHHKKPEHHVATSLSCQAQVTWEEGEDAQS